MKRKTVHILLSSSSDEGEGNEISILSENKDAFFRNEHDRLPTQCTSTSAKASPIHSSPISTVSQNISSVREKNRFILPPLLTTATHSLTKRTTRNIVPEKTSGKDRQSTETISIIKDQDYLDIRDNSELWIDKYKPMNIVFIYLNYDYQYM
jgi:hypothetical protein